ncbi:unnamed protein product [Allacma fusca]|uniref:MRG domain-containing protein n=1 Tax=Allacma fusca TaxID=39272 RepID=A0A8J2KPT6_9HEXA|nr:unnamed protein product [Allacma fusca]
MSGSKLNGKSYKYVDRGGDFERFEAVLVEYKGLYYPAKVLRIGIEEEEFYYYIHYVGWNKTRDEWVWKDRILKRTDENVKMSEGLHAKAEEVAKQIKRKSSSGKEISNGRKTVSGDQDFSRTSGGKTDDSASETDQSSSKEFPQEPVPLKETESKEGMTNIRENYVRFPDLLAQVVVEDHLADREHKLELDIPVSVPIDEILDDYVRHVEESGGNHLDASGLTIALKHDFNTLIRVQLLYLTELTQLKKFESENPILEPSAVFGGHHLLRLCTVIGYRLKDEFPPEDFQRIIKDLENLLEFLAENFKKYFTPNAVTPPCSPLIGSD